MAIAAGVRATSLARGPVANTGALSLRDILAALRRRLWFIVAIGLCGMGLAYAASTQMPPTFEAGAVVAVDSTPPAFESADGQQDSRGDAVANKVELIESRLLIGQVVDEMRLIDNPMFNPPPSSGKIDSATAYLMSWIPEDWLLRVGLAADRTSGEAGGSARPPLGTREIVIDRLKDRLTVAQPPGAEML